MVCIDDDGAKKFMDEGRSDQLKKQTKLDDFQLNTRSSPLAFKLANAPCSPFGLRRILRAFVGANIYLDPNEDPEAHLLRQRQAISKCVCRVTGPH